MTQPSPNTNELLATYFEPGLVGEVSQPGDDILAPVFDMAELRSRTDAVTSIDSDLSFHTVGNLALKLENEALPSQGSIARSSTKDLMLVPEDEFGRNILAISDGDPEITVRFLIEEALSRHAKSSDRFTNRVLTQDGVTPSLDEERSLHEEWVRMQPTLEGESPRVPKISLRALGPWAKQRPGQNTTKNLGSGGK